MAANQTSKKADPLVRRILTDATLLGDRPGGTVEEVIVAELEIYHSRPIAPTRRIALGRALLPVDAPPGAGGMLLAGIVARVSAHVEPDLREGLVNLIEDLDAGRRCPQPRVQHRFQDDQVGLLRSTHRLVSSGDELVFEFDDELGRPVQQALGAIYAAGRLPLDARGPTFDAIRNALLWIGDVDGRFITEVMGGRKASIAQLMSWNDPVAWALEVLGIDAEPADGTTKRIVQRRFRSLLRDAHPDHGGVTDDAAQRIADLTEARRILLAAS